MKKSKKFLTAAMILNMLSSQQQADAFIPAPSDQDKSLKKENVSHQKKKFKIPKTFSPYEAKDILNQISSYSSQVDFNDQVEERILLGAYQIYYFPGG